MAGEPGMSNCPSCDSPAPDQASLCPSCGFRLIATTDAQVLLGLLHGTSGHRTPEPLIPVAANALPTELISLDPAGAPAGPPAASGPRASTASRPGSWSRIPDWFSAGGRPNRVPVLLGGGLAVLIVLGTVAALTGLAGGLGAGTDPTGPAATPKVITLQRVAAELISASASSTLHPQTRGYQARNTLDGREDTAWNADGDKDGRGVGVSLTWAFDRPQHIQQITVRNGYVRSGKDPEVYQHNGRIKRVRVSSDTGSTEWTLQDTPEPQSRRMDLGTTSEVRFEVLEVYPGSKYKDLALTDIEFDAGG